MIDLLAFDGQLHRVGLRDSGRVCEDCQNMDVLAGLCCLESNVELMLVLRSSLTWSLSCPLLVGLIVYLHECFQVSLGWMVSNYILERLCNLLLAQV